MRTLYLLRHAKSSWDDPGLADRERPLAPRGIEDLRFVAEHLRGTAVVPDVLLCSAARRTRQTLERLREEEAIPPECEIHVEDDLYGAGTDALLARLRELPDAAERAMLIGHNPSVQRLAFGLAGSGPERSRMGRKYPTAALATLDLAVDRWRELSGGCARLTAFVRPKDLGAPR